MNIEKNEISLNQNFMQDLFLELLKIINCEAKITNDEITIWDLFFTPTITMGGKTFAFNPNDVQVNTLLGGNGKTYKFPFEYVTNDNLRKIKCDKFGINYVFSINEVFLDKENKEIGTLSFKLSQEENDLIEIHIPQKEVGIHFKLVVSKKYLECSVSFLKLQNGINDDIKIKYKVYKNSNEKELTLCHEYLNRINSNNNFSTFAYFKENFLRYDSDNRNGKFIVRHTNTERRENIKELNLDERELDLYYEDLCFHTKEFISILKQNFCSFSPTFLNIFFLNYPDFKNLLDIIENSQDKGILTNILNTYFKNKEQLDDKDKVQLLLTSK